jgi:hypothetical protein
LVEVMVYKEGFAPTKLQWVQSGLYNFSPRYPTMYSAGACT